MKYLISLSILSLFLFMKSHAQVHENFELTEYRNGYISFATVNKKNKAVTSAILLKELTGNLKQLTWTSAILDLPLKKGKKIRQEKFQLYKNGVKLRGAEYAINSISDTISFISGFLGQISNEQFRSSFDAKTCSSLALIHFTTAHPRGKDERPVEGRIQSVTMVYYFDYEQQKYRPGYEINVTSDDVAFSENIFISAATGKFMGGESAMCSINYPGTAETIYNGTKSIVADATSSTGPFKLQESRNGVLIRTRNMNHALNLTSAVTDIYDNDNNWTAAELGSDQSALDVHWATGKTYDYWLNIHGRNSLDNGGMAIESYIHLGINSPTSQWSPLTYSLQYGDGNFGVNPLTTLDICAHELGHGINQFTGNLSNVNESGALNEDYLIQAIYNNVLTYIFSSSIAHEFFYVLFDKN